ncbi:DUF4192 domain-containing protein [Thermomonospora umbrina]|uniref:Uncharacterized protein DUF4192 n=1 Tax=Thermomonospora umbrina TaxID=111806 RepID=A0A3D9SYN4_9ACTN|nr:DUF4192 domain-containing protein [Thermomonospora umbrina]REF00688.1 uncharacterized protein DUF4192 [Thermomonospora umbrina]
MNEPIKITIASAADAVATVPYMLGFHPEDSLVVVGWNSQGSFGIRLDLITRDHHGDLIRRLRAFMVGTAAEAVILLGYGSEDRTVPLLTEVQDALADILTVKEVLRVNDGRWWSLTCIDHRCCPADGTPYDIASTTIAATAAYAGRVAYGSRREMAATLAPMGGRDRERMQAETERAEAELLRDGGSPPLLVIEGLPMVRSLLGSGARLTDRQVARLSVVLNHLRVRDEAWARIAEHDQDQQLRFWRDMTRRTVGEYTAAPAALLAYTAYMDGDGALAQMALERSRQAVPSYNLAALLQEALNHAISPQAFREKFSLTPEWVAETYGDTSHPA